jgi:hypothetical protein
VWTCQASLSCETFCGVIWVAVEIFLRHQIAIESVPILPLGKCALRRTCGKEKQEEPQ